MPEYRVIFGLLSYWSGSSIRSSDGNFSLNKSSPEAPTLDQAEVMVPAKSPEEAWREAEQAARYYLSVFCFENDCYAQLLGHVSLRGSDGRCEFCCCEQFIVVEHNPAKPQRFEAYEHVKDAVNFYCDGLATKSSIPDYAYLSFFKAIEVLSGGKASGYSMPNHIWDALDKWRVPSRYPDVERICHRRSRVAHGITRRNARRQTPSPEEITEVQSLAKRSILANMDT